MLLLVVLGLLLLMVALLNCFIGRSIGVGVVAATTVVVVVGRSVQ